MALPTLLVNLPSRHLLNRTVYSTFGATLYPEK